MYSWEIEQELAWSWSENTWSARLFHSIKSIEAFRDISLHAAYEWTASNYENRIGSLFPKTVFLKICPFHGMTDILMIAKRVALVRVTYPQIQHHICCVEVGTSRPPACSVVIGGVTKVWPQKFGELLASMNFFGALHHVNNMETVPENVSFTAYGMLVIRSISFILLRMVVNRSGSHVYFLHEGGCLDMGQGLQLIANSLKEVQP